MFHFVISSKTRDRTVLLLKKITYGFVYIKYFNRFIKVIPANLWNMNLWTKPHLLSWLYLWNRSLLPGCNLEQDCEEERGETIDGAAPQVLCEVLECDQRRAEGFHLVKGHVL